VNLFKENNPELVKKLKSILNRTLGQKRYLQLISSVFFASYKKGWLKNNPSYYSHYFVRNLIKPGQTVIDIGGNLGYFTKIFSQLVGTTGKVFTVEPIELYRSVLEKNISGCKNVTVLPYALGETDGTITMGNPTTDKHRHGLMRVLKKEETTTLSEGEKYEVDMRNPLHLFEKLGKIDYIKCDIEGYEIPVIPLIQPLIANQQPMMQIETDGENKTKILLMMWGLGYKSFYAKKKQLIPVTTATQAVIGDLLFVPLHKSEMVAKFIAQ
jgi:FkbM family methyltransferase